MQQPPQYGQGQQGYPGYPQQPGYPPPGYPPQQGYPPPGYGAPMPPPKKKRTGLVLGIVGGVVVLLGAGIPLGIFASDYFASTGKVPSSVPPAAECSIPPQVLEKTGFPSYVGGNPGSSETLPGLKQIGCGFKPGPDENVRDATLNVRVVEYSGEDAERQAKDNFLSPKPEGAPIDVPGIGDKAALVRLVTKSAFSGAELHVLAGANLVTVEVSGWDKGFFSNSPMPQEDSDATVKAIGAEVVKKLPR